MDVNVCCAAFTGTEAWLTISLLKENPNMEVEKLKKFLHTQKSVKVACVSYQTSSLYTWGMGDMALKLHCDMFFDLLQVQ